MGYQAQSHWEVSGRWRSHSPRRFTHRPSKWTAEVALVPPARAVGKLVEVTKRAWAGWWGFFDDKPAVVDITLGVATFGAVGLMLYHCAWLF